jgi:hypothetical protein
MSTPEERFFSAPERNEPPRAAPARRGVRLALACAAALSAAVLAGACGSKKGPPPESAPPQDEPVMASGVNATVIVSKCPDAAHVNVRTAQEAIQRLVGPCAMVPGGRAHFSATLEPGGKIVLASPEGDPAQGVVPTCVLQNRLAHRVPLKSACTLDVQLDERTVPVATADAGPPPAPDAGPPH